MAMSMSDPGHETTPSDRLPERLRAWADGNLRVRDCALIEEAARRIERLRDLVAKQQKIIDRHVSLEDRAP